MTVIVKTNLCALGYEVDSIILRYFYTMHKTSPVILFFAKIFKITRKLNFTNLCNKVLILYVIHVPLTFTTAEHCNPLNCAMLSCTSEYRASQHNYLTDSNACLTVSHTLFAKIKISQIFYSRARSKLHIAAI